MFDLNKLSYQAYGNLVILILLIIALLFNLFPFNLLGLIICVLQIPLYLFARYNFKEPIHAEGLNICFVLTILFYVFLFISIRVMMSIIELPLAIIFSVIINVLGCYATSTVPNKQELKGKLFFGYKKHNESKYQKLIDYIKFNGINPNLIEAEKRLRDLDPQMFVLYKRKFREDKTFREITEEFDLDNPRLVEILDRAYFYMIGALMI